MARWLALPDGRHGNPVRRFAHRARVADGGVRQRRQGADVFGPGMYKLTTQTIPVLTYLKNWDKLFESPFKSDVYFFSTRQQVDQRWGTPQPITIRDKDFGAVRLRAFGNYSYRIADPRCSTPRSPAPATPTPWPTWTASCAA
jgi:hypothetical protein